MTSRFLLLTGLGFALGICSIPASAQTATDAGQADPPTDSGVLVSPRQERIPLDQFLVPLRCPEDEICVEAPYEEEEETPPPTPGDRELDVQAERRALSTLGNSELPTSCSAVGAGNSACAFEQYEVFREERELLDAKVLPPEEPE
ncbi:hypothetical protein B5C34_02855 [Pacificimonas flava]|uniref:Uncharacterized protein n=2 Tax=Pacificimonas TaxID=1960290 RepID=A0A219B3X3_9SPHN|nr:MULTISPECIES: hypothetical protein [Pacificimonas]MBZ6377839.1 hypothetical protein [Pacificimonas aurantium]OWV32498.1 hypothetical protein B5C34_02855 [Pacificimonas flava]